MPSSPVSLCILPETRGAIDEVVRRSGRDFSSVANEMLAEALHDDASWTPERVWSTIRLPNQRRADAFLPG